jgi:hypothetical protein
VSKFRLSRVVLRGSEGAAAVRDFIPLSRREPNEHGAPKSGGFPGAPDNKDDVIAMHRGAHGSSFFWSIQLLPVRRREAMYALYAFCREVDDIADGEESRSLKQALLLNWRSEIAHLFAGWLQHDVTRNEVARKAVLVLKDGTVFRGRGLGAFGQALGEVCFNTSMTGYQEILTDPSYAGQIITFTFPHIGNVGTNDEDVESRPPACRGLVLREDITPAANWRAPAIWVHNSSKADILRPAQLRSAEPAQ